MDTVMLPTGKDSQLEAVMNGAGNAHFIPVHKREGP